MTVDRATDAAGLLTGLGWQVQQNENGIEVRSIDETTSLTINQMLMQNGFLVRQLVMHEPGLEEMFLELTETDKQEAV